jgi:hypothetical protein
MADTRVKGSTRDANSPCLTLAFDRSYIAETTKLLDGLIFGIHRASVSTLEEA